ncbi:MAG TPA: metallophosphoesterase family protein [Steroidobacteraceae bacterium]|nr:metallophosphoesterase family protein [Steroidobacteraceae bacterium]
MNANPSFRIGLIADTHGLLRPEAVRFLSGADHIVHAGDVGGEAILESLRALAPVSAVRGNNDTSAWAERLPRVARVSLAGLALTVVHELDALKLDPPRLDTRKLRTRKLDRTELVVYGHSHRPRILERADGLVCINPGSAGPRRFKLPIAAGEILVGRAGVRVRLVELGGERQRELHQRLIGSHNPLI